MMFSGDPELMKANSAYGMYWDPPFSQQKEIDWIRIKIYVPCKQNYVLLKYKWWEF